MLRDPQPSTFVKTNIVWSLINSIICIIKSHWNIWLQQLLARPKYTRLVPHTLMLLPSHKLTCLLFCTYPSVSSNFSPSKKGSLPIQNHFLPHTWISSVRFGIHFKRTRFVSAPRCFTFQPLPPSVRSFHAWTLVGVGAKEAFRKPGISKYISMASVSVSLSCIVMVTKVSTTKKHQWDLKANTSNTTSISLEISWEACPQDVTVTNTISAVGKAILVLVKGEETLLMPERGINSNQGSMQTWWAAKTWPKQRGIRIRSSYSTRHSERKHDCSESVENLLYVWL